MSNLGKRKRNVPGAAEKVHETSLGAIEQALSQEATTNSSIIQQNQVLAFANSTNKEKTNHNRKSKAKQHLRTAGCWKTSEPIGGKFINAEPVFSSDEKYLILAYTSAICIYSNATSLLVRSLPVSSSNSKASKITAYVLSAIDPNKLYVSTAQGLVYLWDWVEGKKLGRWDLNSQIGGMTVSSMVIAGNTFDIVYTNERKHDRWRVTAHKLMSGTEAADTESRSIYDTRKPLSLLKVLPESNVIVATSGQRLLVGASNSSTITSLGKLKFVWREIVSSEQITCMDVKGTPRKSVGGKVAKANGLGHQDGPVIDVAVGGAKGIIYLHEDLLNKLTQNERQSQSKGGLKMAPRQMHWHREGVSTLKWSLDGNYIISGGLETVLVLWQLDTGKRQYLPHLTSAIESLVVSPTGASYAVRLADNSTMVLSTTELKPTANIPGIQARTHTIQPFSKGSETAVDLIELERTANMTVQLYRTPSAIHPLSSTHLLLAVPASQPSVPKPLFHAQAPYLQTFDLASARHITRQALARTNATVTNIGPEANKIGEPDVKHLKISHDGHWLATVDEWTPLHRDIKYVAVDGQDVLEEQSRRREVFLKFWAWDTGRSEWALVTRVDAPHSTSDGGIGVGRVLDLGVDPSGLGFATIGEDGALRIWKPKTRLRDGIIVRGSNADGLTSWRCHSIIQLGAVGSAQETKGASSTYSKRACVAYSDDGSVLAASLEVQSPENPGMVHVIDTTSGDIQQTMAGLSYGDLIAIAFLDRYLIAISEYLTVWDIVLGIQVFGILLGESHLSPSQRTAMTHLTVDKQSGTFAIALPLASNSKNSQTPHRLASQVHSQIAIFDPSSPTPLFTTSSPHITTSLLPALGTKGYVVLDSTAEVRILSPITTPSISTIASAVGTEVSPANFEELVTEQINEEGVDDTLMRDINESEDEPQEVLTPGIRPTVGGDNDESVVVRPQQLTAIFDIGPSFTLPPVEVLFEQVVDLFSSKSKVI
ncbi:MAG: hypothetical protein M1827_001201 [Pycnora praestabilis]|nr:MAG: hypothetical protein M1827_001201 [Pycnora praestabilis]